MARRGAAAVGEASASGEWRRAADRARRDTEARHYAADRDIETRHPPEEWIPERWAPAEERPGAEAGLARGDRKGPARRRRVPPLPEDITGELAQAGGARWAGRLTRDLASAAAAYEAGRDHDAAKLLRPLAEAAPGAAGVRELYGLTLYRLGRWKPAKAELDAYRALTGAVDQLPVVADCERALGRHAAVDALWEELRQASPGVEVLSEGRLVEAGSLADRGRLDDAIALLARYETDRARPKEWHLRTWYALADLYERAGNVPRARDLFGRLVRRDAEFFDAAERLAALR